MRHAAGRLFLPDLQLLDDRLVHLHVGLVEDAIVGGHVVEAEMLAQFLDRFRCGGDAEAKDIHPLHARLEVVAFAAVFTFD